MYKTIMQVRETLKKWVKQRVSSSDLLSQFFSEKTYTSVSVKWIDIRTIKHTKNTLLVNNDYNAYSLL